MAALYKQSIIWGLTCIPVKLFSVLESKPEEYHFVHNKCRQRIKYKKYCPTCDMEVSNSEIIKGFETEPGKFKEVTSERAENTGELKILNFTNVQAFDPVYFRAIYYIYPDCSSQAYTVLYRAMFSMGAAAVAASSIGGKNNTAIIRAAEKGLVLEILYDNDEIKPFDPGCESISVNQADIETAKIMIANNLK